MSTPRSSTGSSSNIFSGWTCVGHASDLAAVGAQKAVGTGANAVLLVRGDDDTVPRVRQHLPPPRARAAGVRRDDHADAASSARTTRGRTGSTAALRNAPGFKDVDGFDADEFGLAELRLVDWHGWLFVDPSGEDADFAEHVGGLGGRRRAVPRRGPDDRRPALLRAGHQLEGHRRELPGVLPLLHDSPRTVPDQPADQRREPRPDGLVDRRLDVDHREAPRRCR